MLHNNDPFGSPEAPVNMGASVNMSVNGAMNIANGFNNLGKPAHEASHASNPHYNLPNYPTYGHSVMSSHSPMHHFQNFHSNVFQSPFMGHTPPAIHDTSWQHGLLPMNLNTQAESGHGHFYDRKDYPFSEYKEQSLHGKSVPLNVPQVYPKPYHKETPVSHPTYHGYQAPSTLRQYLDNNLDLSMNKTQKPETRSYDLDLSSKTQPLDESRRRSLENTVKMIENILIHNPTSSSYQAAAQKKALMQSSSVENTEVSVKKHLYNDSKSIYNESKTGYNEKHIFSETRNNMNTESKNAYIDSKNSYTPSKNPFIEGKSTVTVSKNLYSDGKTPYTESKILYPASKTPYIDSKIPYTERKIPYTESKNPYNEIKNPFIETKNPYIESRNQYNDPKDSYIASKNPYIENKNLYTENKNPYTDNKNAYTEGKNMYVDRGNPFTESKSLYSENKSTHTETKTFNETRIPESNITEYKDPSAEKPSTYNIFNSKNNSNNVSKNLSTEKFPDHPKPSDDKETNASETSKNEDGTMKSIYSCSTENSVESEINSDERNNNLTNSPENENIDSVNDETSQNQIENITIKVEVQADGSWDESEDVKPASMFGASRNPLDFTDILQTESIDVKIEELSSWADTEHGNPFQRDIFGVTRENTGDASVVEADFSVTAAKEAIARGSESTPKTFYECPSCTLYFENPKRFLIHHKWHIFQVPCERKTVLEMERVMKRNIRKEARQVWKMNNEEIKTGNVAEEGANVFKCNNCDKMFSTRASLKSHKQRYHPTLVRECQICHKTLIGWQAIRTHRQTEHASGDSRYQCSDCPKRFKFSHSLVKHRDTHLEKTHPCEQCPKKFGSKKLLNTHMKTHERLLRGMTFHCSYCGKGFFESYNLQVHERTHRNERPFNCDICHTSFGTNSSLQRHLKVSHSSDKPWQCAKCHRNFVSEKIRDRHVMRYHGDATSFKHHCTLCPCRYLNQKDLNKHMQKNHPRPGRKKRSRKNKEEEENSE